MGHLSRCVTIAKALEGMGTSVHFLVNNDPAVVKMLKDEGIFHLTYPIEGLNPMCLTGKVVVIDTKKDVREQVKSLKEDGRKVVLIDNYSAKGLADDIAVPYASLKGREVDYGFSAGREFIIIGRNFLNAKIGLNKTYSLPLKVLVTMGGADPNNITEKIIRSLLPLKNIEVTAVIGPAAKVSEEFEQMVKDERNIKVLRDVKDLSPLMLQAHVAFTAVGITIYELAYLGVPSILIANYREDRFDLEEMESLKASLSLGFHAEVSEDDIRGAVKIFINDPIKWKAMSESALKVSDGQGAFRIARKIASFTGEDDHVHGRVMREALVERRQ